MADAKSSGIERLQFVNGSLEKLPRGVSQVAVSKSDVSTDR
jgi:hypothetical protein